MCPGHNHRTRLPNVTETHFNQTIVLQIEATNRLQTTLGEGHPSTVAAIASMAPSHEERTVPAPFCGANDRIERLRDAILQFAVYWSPDQGKDDQERLKSSFEMSQKQATEHGDKISEERLQLVLAMSLEVDDNNYTSEERLRRPLDSSIDADVGSQTNSERLQRALAMLMIDEDHNNETGSFKATRIEPDEGNETDEEWLQHALAMSIIDKNCCEELVASEGNIVQHSW